MTQENNFKPEYAQNHEINDIKSTGFHSPSPQNVRVLDDLRAEVSQMLEEHVTLVLNKGVQKTREGHGA